MGVSNVAPAGRNPAAIYLEVDLLVVVFGEAFELGTQRDSSA